MEQLSSSSAAGTPVTRSPRPLHAALALLSLVIAAAGAISACSEGEKCVGGVIVNGVCEGECDPDECKEGNTCVGNRCMLVCDSHQDCNTDAQDCAAAVEDQTEAEIFVCSSSEKALGFGHSCPFGVECGTFGVCPDGARCSMLECGGNPDSCAPDPAACGDHPEGCTAGKCPDGAACMVSACAAAQCSTPLTCLSAGEGDADAYCTTNGCQADADCPSGYFCGITRDLREICGTDKGNSSFCGGETAEACVEQAQLEAQGLFEGSLCALRNTCLKRTPCSPCETDLDCSFVEGQRCVALGGGEKICARSCNADADCDPDYACTANACTPRFGACRGQGNFCEPCQNDTDCGGPETTKGCASLSGNQRACFDYSFPDTCTTDADCPTSPGGRHGECLDEAEGVAPSDSVYHRCYLPYDAPDNKFGCW